MTIALVVVVLIACLTCMYVVWRMHESTTREIKAAYSRSGGKVEDVLSEVMRRDDRLIEQMHVRQQEGMAAMSSAVSEAVTAAADAIRPYARDQEPGHVADAPEPDNPAALFDVADWTDHIIPGAHEDAAVGRPNIPGMTWPDLTSDPIPRPNLAGETYDG